VIQWGQDKVEKLGGTSNFKVCNAAVKATIYQKQENWINGGSAMHLGSDPHNPQNVDSMFRVTCHFKSAADI
jgi:hypothetical protein